MDEAVERVTLAIRRQMKDDASDEAIARAALQAAIPIIGEEMARVADEHGTAWGLAHSTPATVIAEAIRSHAQHLVGKVGD